MIIKIIMNDYKKDEEDYINEHGLSLLIQINNRNLLYDTGLSEKTYSNIEKLGLGKIKLDYIILSHGHYDHVGGFESVEGMLKKDGKIIVGNKFFENKRKYHIYEDKEKKFIGHNLKKTENYIEVSESLNLGDFEIINISSDDNEEKFSHLMIEKNGLLVSDRFEEEIVIKIKERKNTLVTGCTHNDLFRSLNKINSKIDVVIGGVHYKNKKDEEIKAFIKSLKESGVKEVYLMHCTGKKLIKELKKDKFPSKEVFVGDEIEI